MPRKKTKKIGIAGKYGTRYGRKIRENARKAETTAKAKHKCPQCGKESLKRVSTGVWECTKCKTKMAGGAYVPQTGLGKISRRAIMGASKEEFMATFLEEGESDEKPAKKKPKKAPEPLTMDDVSTIEESVEAEEPVEPKEVG